MVQTAVGVKLFKTECECGDKIEKACAIRLGDCAGFWAGGAVWAAEDLEEVEEDEAGDSGGPGVPGEVLELGFFEHFDEHDQ